MNGRPTCSAFLVHRSSFIVHRLSFIVSRRQHETKHIHQLPATNHQPPATNRNRIPPVEERSKEMRMRRAFLGAALVVSAIALHAQTADDIINHYVKTIGGMQKIAAIQSLRRSGRYIGGGGFQAVIREDNKRPNLVRQEFTFQSLTGVTAW